jgi:hypothetical protein
LLSINQSYGDLSFSNAPYGDGKSTYINCPNNYLRIKGIEIGMVTNDSMTTFEHYGFVGSQERRTLMLSC